MSWVGGPNWVSTEHSMWFQNPSINYGLVSTSFVFLECFMFILWPYLFRKECHKQTCCITTWRKETFQMWYLWPPILLLLANSIMSLFSVFFQVDGHYFPGASILFIGKETPHYRAAWRYIMEKLPNFRPKWANADFEDGQNRAAEEETGLELDNSQRSIWIGQKNLWRIVNAEKFARKYIMLNYKKTHNM